MRCHQELPKFDNVVVIQLTVLRVSLHTRLKQRLENVGNKPAVGCFLIALHLRLLRLLFHLRFGRRLAHGLDLLRSHVHNQRLPAGVVDGVIQAPEELFRIDGFLLLLRQHLQKFRIEGRLAQHGIDLQEA